MPPTLQQGGKTEQCAGDTVPRGPRERSQEQRQEREGGNKDGVLISLPSQCRAHHPPGEPGGEEPRGREPGIGPPLYLSPLRTAPGQSGSMLPHQRAAPGAGNWQFCPVSGIQTASGPGDLSWPAVGTPRSAATCHPAGVDGAPGDGLQHWDSAGTDPGYRHLAMSWRPARPCGSPQGRHPTQAASQPAHHPDPSPSRGLIPAQSSRGAAGGGGPAQQQLCFPAPKPSGVPLLKQYLSAARGPAIKDRSQSPCALGGCGPCSAKQQCGG